MSTVQQVLQAYLTGSIANRRSKLPQWRPTSIQRVPHATGAFRKEELWPSRVSPTQWTHFKSTSAVSCKRPFSGPTAAGMHPCNDSREQWRQHVSVSNIRHSTDVMFARAEMKSNENVWQHFWLITRFVNLAPDSDKVWHPYSCRKMNLPQSSMAQKVKLVNCIREVTSSNLTRGIIYTDWGFPCFFCLTTQILG
jgi:hypothetical protein